MLSGAKPGKGKYSGRRMFYFTGFLLLALLISFGIKTYAKNSAEASALLNKKSLDTLTAGSILDPARVKGGIDTCFYAQTIKASVKNRIMDKSYKENGKVALSELRYVRVLYYGFDEETHIGELIVNKKIAKDILAVFKELYNAKYPIEKMVLVDEYEADDEASMKDDNTSAFNYRTIAGSNNLSKHALGLAIDINPLYNPSVQKLNGKTVVSPAEGKKYVNRSLENPYYIKKDDICYQAFIKRGFTWGGSWSSLKDYQHFQKSIG